MKIPNLTNLDGFQKNLLELNGKQVKAVRDEADSVKRCFTDQAHQAMMASATIAAIMASILKGSFDPYVIGIGAMLVSALCVTVAKVGCHKYNTSNRVSAYQIHLSRVIDYEEAVWQVPRILYIPVLRSCRPQTLPESVRGSHFRLRGVNGYLILDFWRNLFIWLQDNLAARLRHIYPFERKLPRTIHRKRTPCNRGLAVNDGRKARFWRNGRTCRIHTNIVDIRPRSVMNGIDSATSKIRPYRLHTSYVRADARDYPLPRLNRRTTTSPNVSSATARLYCFSFGYRVSVPLSGVL